MSKVESVGCPIFSRIIENAVHNAFDMLPTYWNDSVGDSVTSKGSLEVKAECGCGKKATVTMHFKKVVGATDFEGKPVNAYDFVTHSDSIKVSGPKCGNDQNSG